MNAKEICLRLLAAESEAEVGEIIESVPEMCNQNNWRPLDQRDTNFNVTSNQASDGGKALTELMTNMVDAVLMKHALQKGIDPKSSEAPKTMYDAVDVLVKNLRGGKLINLDSNDPWLREFAQDNLVIGITGAKSRKAGLPCYTFVDNGEGQRAENFEDTFLSLSAGHKKSIPFVQGKYNMGSSGVLQYCGRRWFKLIISRRYDGKSEWSWTLMRRRPDNGDNMPVAEYFIAGNTGIASFDSDQLYPFKTTAGKRYGNVFLKTGTVIKLFDYKIGSKFLNFGGVRNAFNENLVETILPFRLMDFRQVPNTEKALEAAKKRWVDKEHGIESRPFYGMEFLLLRSHKEESLTDDNHAEEGQEFPVGIIEDSELGQVSIRAILLKREIPGWLKSPKSNCRVFHAVNGQVQHKQTRGYVSQQCGFPALMDRLVIIVDASKLSFYAHNEVWKGDREYIRETIIGERYLDKVKTTIKESAALQDLQKKIAQEELEHASKVESNELFQKLVNSDRNLANLLSQRDPEIRMPDPAGSVDGKTDGASGWYGGKYSPSYVQLEERFKKDSIEIPINKTRQLVARTDAQNGYLSRSDNPGKIVIDSNVRAKFSIRQHLYDGQLVIYLEPKKDNLSVGDIFAFKIGLIDDAMYGAVESEQCTILMVEENESSLRKKKKKSNKHHPDEGKTEPKRGLPKCVLLTHDGREIDGYSVEKWPDDFNKHDGGLIKDLGDDGVVYKINYDNAYHLKCRQQQRDSIAREVVTQKYILGMRILMLGYEHALRSMQEINDEISAEAEFADAFRRMAARGAASTVLTLAENLPKFVNPSSVRDDVE